MDDIKMQDLQKKEHVDQVSENICHELIGCFAAGTLVRTDSSENFGLKPIEQIKAGDRVLCRAEDGSGETCYKPVIQTFSNNDKEVWLVETDPLVNWIEGQGGEDLPDSGSPERFAVTPNHSFWVVGVTSYNRSVQDFESITNPRWMCVDQIPENGVVIDQKGRLHAVTMARPFSKMKDSNLAWLRGGSREKWWREDDGSVYDIYRKKRWFSSFEIVDSAVYNRDMEQEDGSYPAYTTMVYNLEVDEHHTYFVGFTGIWVNS